MRVVIKPEPENKALAQRLAQRCNKYGQFWYYKKSLKLWSEVKTERYIQYRKMNISSEGIKVNIKIMEFLPP